MEDAECSTDRQWFQPQNIEEQSESSRASNNLDTKKGYQKDYNYEICLTKSKLWHKKKIILKVINFVIIHADSGSGGQIS